MSSLKMPPLNESVQSKWSIFREKNKTVSQFLLFFVICNGVTVLQLVLMPLLKELFGMTKLVQIGFQVLPIGTNLDHTQYFVFDYAPGSIAQGGGGGIAYFAAVELSMAVAQVVNFFSQKKITFKSEGSLIKTAFWYLTAYFVITIFAAVMQGIYKVPLYESTMNLMGTGHGMILGDLITMLVNCTISFWVFFPVMKWIFHK